MTSKKQIVSAEYFNEVVDKLEIRAKKFLRREAQVGKTSRVSGISRIRRRELNSRLGRLRNHLCDCVEAVGQYRNGSEKKSETEAWISVLNTASRILENQHFQRLQERTIRKQLDELLGTLEEAISHLGVEIVNESEKLAPDLSLDLLTAEEVEAFFEDSSDRSALVTLLRTDQHLRAARDEIMALIKGTFFRPATKGGPYEKRRGRWIASFLFGLAEGLGLQPTRNISPQQHSQLHSAADAVAIVIGRLQTAIHVRQNETDNHEAWRNDPAAQAVLSEFPKSRGQSYSAEATAEYLIRQIFSSKHDYIIDARNIGRRIGEREAPNKA